MSITLYCGVRQLDIFLTKHTPQERPPPNPIKRMFLPDEILLKFLLNTIGIELDDVFPVFFIIKLI